MHNGATLISEAWCEVCALPCHRRWRYNGREFNETVSCRCVHDQAFMGNPPAPVRSNAVRQVVAS